MNPRSRSSERGSVLLYIFIAVVAFAALSFAISNTSRDSATTLNKEKSDLSTAEIFDFANAVRNSLQAMTIQGVQQNQVCFDSPAFGATTYQYAACGNPKNEVFNTGGGNAPAPRQMSASLLNSAYSALPNFGYWYFPNSVRVKGVGQDCDPNPDCNEMIAILAPLTDDICININKKTGITNPDTIPVNGSLVNLTPYLGSFAFDSIIDAANLVGKRTGCFRNTNGTNVFYAVLIAH